MQEHDESQTILDNTTETEGLEQVSKALSNALAELVEILHREDIEFSDDTKTLADNSRDASIFTMTPQIVIYPRNSSEIATIVRNIKTPLSITPRAGGTCMTGAPLTESVLINLTRHMTYIEVLPELQQAIVEMGAMYRDLEFKTLEHEMYLASYTSSKDICGIGGMIGNNSSGEKSIRYGATIDNVLSLKVVLHDGIEYTFEEIDEKTFIEKTKLDNPEGDIYRTVQKELATHELAIQSLYKNHPVKKCASGYRIDKVVRYSGYSDDSKDRAPSTSGDAKTPKEFSTKTYNLASLFVGSQSTLGIITEAKVKLTKKQEHRKMLFMGIQSLAELPLILKTIMSHDPESVETFDINTFERAKSFYPEHTNRVEDLLGLKGSLGKTAGLNAHEGLNSTTGENKSTGNRNNPTLFVIAEFASDHKHIVLEQEKAVTEELKSLHDLKIFNIDNEATYESIWKMRRTSFGVMRDYKDGTKHAVPCIEDVIVPITKFDIFIPKLINILTEQQIFFGFHGHIGDGALRIIPVFDLAAPDVVTKIDSLCKAVFSLIKELGGNMSADHSDGIIRTPYLREFYGDEIYNIFVEIKKTLDPEGIFNPGKKIGGTVEDIKKYMIEV